MYIDWVGDQPGLLTDVTTGEIMRSSYLFHNIRREQYDDLCRGISK